MRKPEQLEFDFMKDDAVAFEGFFAGAKSYLWLGIAGILANILFFGAAVVAVCMIVKWLFHI